MITISIMYRRPPDDVKHSNRLQRKSPTGSNMLFWWGRLEKITFPKNFSLALHKDSDS